MPTSPRPTQEPASPAFTLDRRGLLRRAAGGAGLLTLGSLVSACGGATQPSTNAVSKATGSSGGGKPVQLIKFGVEYDASSFDYTQSYDFSDTFAVVAISEPLMRINASGQLLPNLAESYSIADPHQIVFKIRPGLHFTDASPLTADDVAYSMSRHLDPAVASLLAIYYRRVHHVEATGPLEVTAFMTQPDVQFPMAMATNAGAVSSRAFIERHGKAFGTPGVGTIGTGPYRFVSWTKGQGYTLARNDAYWNTAAAPARVRTFTVDVIPDEGTLLAALRSGELDGQVQALSGRGVASLTSATNIRQYRVPTQGGSNLSINSQRAPWSDPRVRQALSLVIPRVGLLKSVWGNQGLVYNSMVTPPMWAYSRPIFASAYARLPNYAATNVDAARRLISAAGAHGAKGSIWVATGFDTQQAEAIQSAAAQIGLSLTPSMQTISNYNAGTNASTKPYDMVIGLYSADLPDPGNIYDTYYYGTPSENGNPQAFNDSQVNAWISEQSTILNDTAARARLLSDAQGVVVAQQVDPTLVCPYTVLSLNARLGGYQMQGQWQWDPHFIASLSGA